MIQRSADQVGGRSAAIERFDRLKYPTRPHLPDHRRGDYSAWIFDPMVIVVETYLLTRRTIDDRSAGQETGSPKLPDRHRPQDRRRRHGRSDRGRKIQDVVARVSSLAG